MNQKIRETLGETIAAIEQLLTSDYDKEIIENYLDFIKHNVIHLTVEDFKDEYE